MNLAYAALWAQEHATKLSLESPHHGPDHWRDVARIGLHIVEANPEAHAPTVFLFAALHDTQREDEFEDPEHGRRAWKLAGQMWTEGIIDKVTMGELHMPVLCAALIGHDNGGIHANDTIAACWDADRLTIARVGKVPSLEFMSSPVVAADFEGWTNAAQRVMEEDDMPWEDIAAEYEKVAR